MGPTRVAPLVRVSDRNARRRNQVEISQPDLTTISSHISLKSYFTPKILFLNTFISLRALSANPLLFMVEFPFNSGSEGEAFSEEVTTGFNKVMGKIKTTTGFDKGGMFDQNWASMTFHIFGVGYPSPSRLCKARLIFHNMLSLLGATYTNVHVCVIISN